MTAAGTVLTTEAGARRLELRLDLLQFLELDRTVDLGLDVGDVPLRAAQQGADHAGDARQASDQQDWLYTAGTVPAPEEEMKQ